MNTTKPRHEKVREATRRRRQEKGVYQRRKEADKAMKLYFRDNAAARRGERPYPNMVDYAISTTEFGPRELVATEYAKSRFAELKASVNWT